MSITQFHFTRRYRRPAAGAAVVAVGALLAACGSSGTTTTTTGAAAAAATATAPAGGAPAGFGKAVTGTAAAKAKAAALAKYPGTAERVMQVADGSYVVHVLRSSGEVHVKVSKDFKVTGTQQGPPAGAAPPAATGTGTGTQS